MYKHLLIPTDGSPLSTEAVERALDFARDAGARATVLIATEPLHIFSLAPDQITPMYSEYERQVSEHANRLLAAAEQKAKGLGVSCDTLKVENAHPYKAIIATADERGCDLIAMASHGRSGFSAVVLGSETLKVLAHSKIPVLVYR
jgi:nucleotide-binding universal stress UspA family protein